jgi:hypothetical protein
VTIHNLTSKPMEFASEYVPNGNWDPNLRPTHIPAGQKQVVKVIASTCTSPRRVHALPCSWLTPSRSATPRATSPGPAELSSGKKVPVSIYFICPKFEDNNAYWKEGGDDLDLAPPSYNPNGTLSGSYSALSYPTFPP